MTTGREAKAQGMLEQRRSKIVNLKVHLDGRFMLLDWTAQPNAVKAQ
jgi:hypothetical protein